MRQLSFYSVEANTPRIADLAGLLCGPGQAVRFGTSGAARVSIVLPDRWRVDALAAACAERNVAAEVGVSEEGHPSMRTAFRADLTELTIAWTKGAMKSVPDGLDLDGQTLRVWTLAAGAPAGRGYLLGLDPRAPDTHRPLAAALTRTGLPAELLGPRGGGPALRLTGRRRVARLLELVGDPPQRAPEQSWPAGIH